MVFSHWLSFKLSEGCYQQVLSVKSSNSTSLWLKLWQRGWDKTWIEVPIICCQNQHVCHAKVLPKFHPNTLQPCPSPISDSLVIINSLTASPLEDNSWQGCGWNAVPEALMSIKIKAWLQVSRGNWRWRGRRDEGGVFFVLLWWTKRPAGWETYFRW